MISVGKSRPNIPSIVCTIFGPLNHELEHFSHCDTTLLLENSGVFRLQDNFDKIYNRTSNVVLRATFESSCSFYQINKVKKHIYKRFSKMGISVRAKLEIPKLGCKDIFTTSNFPFTSCRQPCPGVPGEQR